VNGDAQVVLAMLGSDPTLFEYRAVAGVYGVTAAEIQAWLDAGGGI
jgi:hypothetical protein